MPRIAVILSGCGVFDGAEIHESVLTLLALDQANAQYQCFAPDMEQRHVIDHRSGKPVEGQSRNVLEESARIARGDILPLDELNVEAFDGIVLPGGFGAAKNLCSFAIDGADMAVDASLADKLTAAQRQGKALAFACIAPAIAAKLFGPDGLRFTIGNDADTAKTLESFGGKHVDCPVDDIVTDDKLNIITSPAYMLAKRIGEAHAGITKLVNALLARIGQTASA